MTTAPVSLTFPPCPPWCQTDHDDPTQLDLAMFGRGHEHTLWERKEPTDPRTPRSYVTIARVDNPGEVGVLELLIYCNDVMVPNGNPASEARGFATAIATAADLFDEWSRP